MRQIGYTVLDIINNIIIIKEKVKSIYKCIENEQDIEYESKIVAGALRKEQENHIEYYKRLKVKLENENLEEIDFVIYDKISSLIIEYKNKVDILYIKPKYITELLNLALDFQQENTALMIDIQGRLLKKAKDVDSKNYKTLSEILNHEQKYIQRLSNLLKS